MKRIIYIFIASVCLFISCSKNSEQQKSIQLIAIPIEISEGEHESYSIGETISWKKENQNKTSISYAPGHRNDPIEDLKFFRIENGEIIISNLQEGSKPEIFKIIYEDNQNIIASKTQITQKTQNSDEKSTLIGYQVIAIDLKEYRAGAYSLKGSYFTWAPYRLVNVNESLKK